MRLIRLLVLLYIPFAFGATPVIEVGVSDNMPANHPSILLMHKAYKQIGYRMKLVLLPLERSAVESNKGLMLDAELGRTAEVAPLLPNMIMVPVPIGSIRITAFSTQPGIKIQHWQDLKAWRVDVQRGLYLATINLEGQHYTEVSHIQQAIQRLQSKRTDIALLLGDETEKLLQQQNNSSIKAIQPDLANPLVFHYVHQRHADLVPQLEQALLKLTK